MKLYSNKKYNTIAVYAIIVIAVNVLLITAIFKLNAILGLLDKIVTVMMPIIWGLGLAFLINPLMVTTERMALKVIKKPKRPKLLRAFSVTVASIIFLGLVAGIIAVIVPEFVKSFNDIVNNFSSLVEKAENSKLKVGNTFSCSLFILGEPLYLNDLVQENNPPVAFVVGNKDGLVELTSKV